MSNRASLHARFSPLVLSMGCFAAASRSWGGADGKTIIQYQVDSYDENDDRIDVFSHYFDLRHETAGGTALAFRYVLDSVSGATPVGTYDRTDPTKWDFAEIEDERRSWGVTVEQKIDDFTLSFEYVRSVESDYISNSFALNSKVELFDKNTILSAGIAYADDTIVATPGTVILENRHKQTLDVALGVSQLLTKSTILDLNIGYGYSQGYHSDPYRQISQTDTFSIDTPFGPIEFLDTFNFPENRPDRRDRGVIKLTATQYIKPLDASIIGSFRLFADGDGIVSQTYEVTWNQQITKYLILSPFFRFYNQSAADFYYPSLTGTGIMGTDANYGAPPNYSSDYRVSAFQSVSYGVALDCRLSENLALNFKAERYEMNGRSPGTPSIFFPTAQVLSAGLRFTF